MPVDEEGGERQRTNNEPTAARAYNLDHTQARNADTPGHRNQVDPTRWHLPFKVKHGESRLAHGCPMPSCRYRASSVSTLLKHMRKEHGRTSGKLSDSATTELNASLAPYGAWFCATHQTFNGLANGCQIAKTGLYTLRYRPCTGCGLNYRPPFRPLPRSAFIIPDQLPSDSAHTHGDLTTTQVAPGLAQDPPQPRDSNNRPRAADGAPDALEQRGDRQTTLCAKHLRHYTK